MHRVKPVPARLEQVLLAAAEPLPLDVIVNALAADGFGPTPSSRAVENELRGDATRYSKLDGGYVHVDRRHVVVNRAARERPSVSTVTRKPRAELVEAWHRHDEALWRWQAEALAAWEMNKQRGIVSAVTGAGKTNLGIAAITKHVSDGGCAVVIVPTQELMHQWESRIRTWGGTRLRIGKLDGTHRARLAGNDVLITVVHTAARRLHDELAHLLRPALLVADECHRYGAETFRRALTGPYVGTLGLSATPERTGDAGMQEAVVPRLGPIIYEYGYERALADRVIAEFAVTFVGLDFSRHHRDRYRELTSNISDLLRSLIDAYPELEENPYLYEELEDLMRETGDRRIAELFRVVSERQQLLQHAPSRTKFVRWLASRGMPGQRGILFHSRIEGCEQLARILRDAGVASGVHHSGLAKPERKAALRAFAGGRIQVLCSPRTLDEGIDAPDADFAVIVAGSTVTRQRVQRLGRVLRRTDGKVLAKGFVLYVRETVEDPKARDDAFARELQRLDRAKWVLWPEEGENLSA